MEAEKLILFVEDDPVLSRCYSLWATKMGFAHHLSPSGIEALEFLRSPSSTKPVLIFMDLMMPVLGGPDTINEIRSCDFDTPIICASSLSQDEMRQKMYDIGANDYLQKPIHYAQFHAAVEKSFKG